MQISDDLEVTETSGGGVSLIARSRFQAVHLVLTPAQRKALANLLHPANSVAPKKVIGEAQARQGIKRALAKLRAQAEQGESKSAPSKRADSGGQKYPREIHKVDDVWHATVLSYGLEVVFAYTTRANARAASPKHKIGEAGRVG